MLSAQHSPRRYQVVSEWLNGVSEGAAVMEVQHLESELIVETGGGVQKGESVRWDKCLHFSVAVISHDSQLYLDASTKLLIYIHDS